MHAQHLCARGFVPDEVIYFGDGPIEHSHFVAMIVHIQNKILAHDSQTNQADVAIGVWHTTSRRICWSALKIIEIMGFRTAGERIYRQIAFWNF
jgi:hypothetical protein